MKGTGILFGVLALIYEIAVMIIVGLLIGYDRIDTTVTIGGFAFGNRSVYNTGMYAMVVTVLILLIVGN